MMLEQVSLWAGVVVETKPYDDSRDLLKEYGERPSNVSPMEDSGGES